MKTVKGVTAITSLLVSRLRLSKRTVILASATVFIVGCASAAKPLSAELQAAELAISNAERAQVVRYTSSELNTARNELNNAKIAVVAKNMPDARRLALQAQLSAELALARAELLKAQAVNKDMQQSIDALQREAQRNLSGVRP